jgi:cephalosporin hydroxylase
MKKIYTRREFNDHLKNSANEMNNDKQLKQDALQLIAKADEYNWLHQTTWFGEPIINLPQDMFALQEIIFKTRPEYIIELGVAWGGQLLFFSTIMEILGGKKIIGVDIFIPDDLKERLYSNKKLSNRIELITGSSIEEESINKIKKIVGHSKKVLVILDSHHTHDHVLKELNIYEQFVGKGYYLLCADTIVELIPKNKYRPRDWGPGNNPMSALEEFRKINDRFVSDTEIENKLLLSCNYTGYLKAIK